MTAYLNYPEWIRPEIIPNLPFRWYGLMYLAAFLVAYLLFSKQVKERNLNYSKDDIANFFVWGIVGLLIGARIFGTLVYDTTGLYLKKPWLIFLPFSEDWHFIGYMGMSFHGGVIGGIIGVWLYCKKYNRSFLELGDMLAISIPLGYTFGRLGIFINGELWGKVTTAPWGMVFPYAQRFPTNEPWVQEIMSKIGMTSTTSLVNLPRHPSQLYEALFEGIVLGCFMWFFIRKHNKFKGFAMSIFITGYGIIRFILEYFREPDADLGYIIKLGNPQASIHLFTTPFNFSMGQLLSFIMIVGGLVLLFVCRAKNKKEHSNNTLS